MKSLPLVGMRRMDCPECGEMVRPEIIHVVESDSPLAAQPLAMLGIPAYDIVRVEDRSGQHAFLLSADRPAVMGQGR
jgi:hypothetical protein